MTDKEWTVIDNVFKANSDYWNRLSPTQLYAMYDHIKKSRQSEVYDISFSVEALLDYYTNNITPGNA